MPSTRARRRTARVVGVVVTALAAAAATLAAGATVWAHQTAGDERLLAGTRVGAVDVGGDTAEQARRAVADHLADELAEPIAVSVDDRRVATVTPAELGAEADVDAAVHRARTHGAEASAPRRELACTRASTNSRRCMPTSPAMDRGGGGAPSNSTGTCSWCWSVSFNGSRAPSTTTRWIGSSSSSPRWPACWPTWPPGVGGWIVEIRHPMRSRQTSASSACGFTPHFETKTRETSDASDA